ncbi:hypothetical protein [Staphylococcus equorum]|uniref:hypothetical protein n=1 Tax=Staphylococcus equorum TaxID=246432 RepID=UPI003FD74DEA
MKTINDLMKTHLPSEYNGFSIGEFLNRKKLKIESVRADRISGRRCIKVDVRIVEDKSNVNKNKVFTVRLDESNTFEEGELDAYLKETKNYLGFPLIVDVEEDIEQAYFFQQNMLTLVVNNYLVDTDAEKQEVEITSMKERPLKNIGDYRIFDINQFFKDNSASFVGTYYEKGNVMFNVLVNKEVVVKVAVPIEKYDSLPASLLTLNKPFEECVSDYTFAHATSHRYGTRWTLNFKDITFKPGIIMKEAFKLAYDEPRLEVANAQYDSGIDDIDEVQNDISKEQSSFEEKARQEYRETPSKPFGKHRHI